jgi:hypothetical protein
MLRAKLRVTPECADVTDVLKVPHQSINALMQYLKRKHLVKKTGQEFSAPYALTLVPTSSPLNRLGCLKELMSEFSERRGDWQ